MSSSFTVSLILFFAFLHHSLCLDIDADIAIVGGGTAGSVLAARLCSGLPSLKIVVLEKGPAKDPKDDLLRKAIRMQGDVIRQSFVDQLKSEPVPAFNGRRVTIVVGTGFGGASNINGGYVAMASNNMYRRVFRHMSMADIRKSKRNMRATARTGTLFPEGHKFGKVLQKAVRDAKINVTRRPNQAILPEDDRILQETTFTQSGMRQPVDETYIGPVRAKCKNLRLLNNVLVDRVELKRTPDGTYLATGLHVITGGKDRHFVKVRREIVLSAGELYTPPILHRSGIGPVKLLRRLGIMQKVNLSVGPIRNKIVTLAFGKYKRPAGSRVNDPAFILSDESKRTFWAGKGGPLATGMAGGGGEMQLPGGTCHFSVTAETKLLGRQPLKPSDPGTLFSACMCPSDARGRVEARSKDPMQPPKILLNFVNSPLDTGNIRRCAKVIQAIFQSMPKNLQAEKTYPSGGLENYEWKNSTGTSYHLSGGCAVGRVLDWVYQVKGTKGLRVVDASSVPAGYAYGLFPATLMFAEHSSSVMIKKHSNIRKT